MKQTSRSPSQPKNKSGPFLALLLLLAAGFCLLLALPSRSTKSDLASSGPAIPSAFSPQAEKLVNKHLFLTSQEQDWAQKKMQAENTFSAPEVGHSILTGPSKSKLKSLGIDHSNDQNEDNAFNDLNRYPKEINYTNPEAVIQGQLQDQQRQQAYDKAYRKEYARQFIENARLHGYQVKLNNDFVVISISPIIQPALRIPGIPDSRAPSSEQAR